MRGTEYAERFDSPLDRNISYAVKVLRDAGIETYESCESGRGHAFPEPTVRFGGVYADGMRLSPWPCVRPTSSRSSPNLAHERGELVGPNWS